MSEFFLLVLKLIIKIIKSIYSEIFDLISHRQK